MTEDDLHAGHRRRMLKKYSENGIDCFEDHEKLEILLYLMLPRGNTNDIAHMLMNRFGSLSGVLNARCSDLKEIRGVGSAVAYKMNFLGAFFRCLNREKPQQIVLDSTDKAAEYCRKNFDFKIEEEMTALFLDKKSTLIGQYNIKGYSSNAIRFDLKEFSRRAVESKCVGVVLAHSHLFTPLLPSDSDIITTRKIANTLQTIGIELIDHIIVNDWGEYSMRLSADLRDVWH